MNRTIKVMRTRTWFLCFISVSLWLAVGCGARSADPFLTKKIDHLGDVISVCYPDKVSGHPRTVADLQERVTKKIGEGRLDVESQKVVTDIQADYRFAFEESASGSLLSTAIYIVKISSGEKLFVITVSSESK